MNFLNITLNSTIIVTVALLHPFFIQQNKVLAQSTSLLIGAWKRGGNVSGDDETVTFSSDGRYSSKLETTTRPGGVYGSCATFEFYTTVGRFAVNGSQITFQPQTMNQNSYAACGTAFVNQTSLPKQSTFQNTYIVDSFSLENNGQTLVLQQTGGNIKTATQGNYQKSSS